MNKIATQQVLDYIKSKIEVGNQKETQEKPIAALKNVEDQKVNLGEKKAGVDWLTNLLKGGVVKNKPVKTPRAPSATVPVKKEYDNYFNPALEPYIEAALKKKSSFEALQFNTKEIEYKNNMNKAFTAYKQGFLKSAQEAGLDEQECEAVFEQMLAQNPELADQLGSGLGEEEEVPAEVPVEDGQLGDEEIAQLAEAISQHLMQGQSVPMEEKQAAVKDNAAYIEGFFRAAKEKGFGKQASYTLFKKAYEASVASLEPVEQFNEKTAQAYYEGVFEKAAQYGLSQEQTLAVIKNLNK